MINQNGIKLKWRWRTLGSFLVPGRKIIQNTFLIVLCLVCYGPSIPDSSFVFDDLVAIVQNNDVTDKHVSIFSTIYNILRHDFWGSKIIDPNSHKSYRPLVSLTYNLEYRFLENQWFHLQPAMKCTNLLMHCYVCCLLFSTLKQMFKKEKETVLYMTTVLFAIHPVHTEAVAGLVGRAELMCFIFYLLTFQVYNSICSEKLRPFRKTVELYACLFIFATASLFSKELGIMALPFCMAYDVVLFSQLKFKKRNTLGYAQRKLVGKLVVLGLATLALYLLRMAIMGFKGPKFRPIENPVAFADSQLTKILSQNYLYVLNFWLLICPDWLSFDWSFGSIRLVESVLDVRVLAIGIFYIFSTIIILKKSRTLLMMYLWMVIPFIPSSGLITLGFVIAERVLYIPSTGFCLLICLGWDQICSYSKKLKYLANFGMIILCAIFMVKTWHRSNEWTNEQALFSSAVYVCPNNAKVFYNIARLASYANDSDKAHDYYLHAIELYPNYDAALMNLGNLYRSKHQLDLAEQYIQKSVEVTEEFPAGWMNLGIIKATKGLHNEALHCYNQALKYKRRYPNALYNLGNLYLAMNNPRLALHSWTSALNIESNHAPSWVNLLTLLDSEGQYLDVIKLSSRALEIFPLDPAIIFIRANACGKLNRFEEAEHLYRTAIELRPDHVMYHVNMGVLYHRWNRKDLAAKCYNEALELNPKLENVRKYLQMLDEI